MCHRVFKRLLGISSNFPHTPSQLRTGHAGPTGRWQGACTAPATGACHLQTWLDSRARGPISTLGWGSLWLQSHCLWKGPARISCWRNPKSLAGVAPLTDEEAPLKGARRRVATTGGHLAPGSPSPFTHCTFPHQAGLVLLPGLFCHSTQLATCGLSPSTRK